MTRSQKLTLSTLVILTLGLLGYLAYALLAPTETAPTGTAQGGYADQPTLGQASAPVKLIMFENFLCEHCKAFEEEVFPQLERDYVDTGKVEVYYVNLAWGEERARLAGLAGECAYRQDEGAFWNYKTALYEAQQTWQDLDDLVMLATSSELDTAALRTCLEEERYQDEVQRDLDLADEVGVQGTPSLVIGDQGLQGPSYDTLKRTIDAQLSGS